MVEIGCPADALNVAEGVHLRAGGATHSVRASQVSFWKPCFGNSFIDGEGQHLRQVGFDEGRRLVHYVVKQAIGPLVLEATIQNLLDEVGKVLAVLGSGCEAGCGSRGRGPQRPSHCPRPRSFHR